MNRSALNQPEVRFAVDAVRQAALLVQQVQREMVSPALTKTDRSPVTVADFASQALIGSLLEQQYPNDLLVAEEDSTVLRTADERSTLEQVTRFTRSAVRDCNPEAVCRWIDFGRVDSAPRFWTLDPIDGTKGFLRGDQYVVALALVEAGEVQIGVLGCPNLVDGWRTDVHGNGSLFLALRGQGTWLAPLTGEGEFRKVQVSNYDQPQQARLLRSFESGHTNVSQIDEFAGTLGIQAEPVRMDSQAKYGVLASGHGEIILRLLSPDKPDYREKIWDQAAGALILEEAGGRITDLDGKSLDFTRGRSLSSNRGILATNGRLHEQALQALRQVGA